MNKIKIEAILQEYGRIYRVASADRLAVLKSLKSDTKALGSAYENYRKALLASALKQDADTILFANRALEAGKKSDNDFILEEVNVFIGIHYRITNRYEQAFSHYIAALRVRLSARVYNNLADLYLLIGAYEEARFYLDRALTLLNNKAELDDIEKNLISVIYTNQSEAHLLAGDHTQAEKTAHALIGDSIAKDKPVSLANGYKILGMVSKDKDIALDYYMKAEKIFSNLEESRLSQVQTYLDEILILEAEVYHSKKSYVRALDQLSQVVIKDTSWYDLKVKCLEATGDYELAYATYQAFMKFMKDEAEIKRDKQKTTFETNVAVFESEKRAIEYELLYSNTKSISEIGKEIISSERLDSVLGAISRHIGNIMHFDSLALGIIEDNHVCYNWVIEDEKPHEAFIIPIKSSSNISSWVVRNRQSLKIDDTSCIEDLKKNNEFLNITWYGNQNKSVIMAPIIFKNEVLGVVNLQSRQNNIYSEYDLEVINMLASFIGVAMKNWQGTQELIQVNEKLESLSKTDALTGISNRHILSEIVEDLFKNGTDQDTISVAIIDIDHFKEFNDTYGHYDGDKCIIEIVDVLRQYLDVDGNRLFRYGGDEFVAIIPDANKTSILSLLEAARNDIEKLSIPNKKSKVSDFVTCTFGFTTVRKGIDYQKAFYLADEALYQAKANGKNCVRYSSEEVS